MHYNTHRRVMEFSGNLLKMDKDTVRVLSKKAEEPDFIDKKLGRLERHVFIPSLNFGKSMELWQLSGKELTPLGHASHYLIDSIYPFHNSVLVVSPYHVETEKRIDQKFDEFMKDYNFKEVDVDSNAIMGIIERNVGVVEKLSFEMFKGRYGLSESLDGYLKGILHRAVDVQIGFLKIMQE